jgi:hypothetical protein
MGYKTDIAGVGCLGLALVLVQVVVYAGLFIGACLIVKAIFF